MLFDELIVTVAFGPASTAAVSWPPMLSHCFQPGGGVLLPLTLAAPEMLMLPPVTIAASVLIVGYAVRTSIVVRRMDSSILLPMLAWPSDTTQKEFSLRRVIFTRAVSPAST